MKGVTLQDKVAFLRDPRSYPGRPRRVEVIETHFAWVFLTTRHAYKLKKPVRHPAMDYRSVAARKRGCTNEVRLNRRLAPKVYLSTVPLKVHGGSLSLDGDGRIVDWLVKMRRLPASHMLTRVLSRRSVRSKELDRLVGCLTVFFNDADPVPMGRDRYVQRYRREVSRNENALRRAGSRIRQPLVRAVATMQKAFIQRAGTLLAQRGRHVVEGHGDLRAEHVSLGPPACVIDCLEFSRALRLFDPAEELAFLSLEIERLGHPRLAAELVCRFRLASGDDISDAIVSFYRSHRATTRAKLAVRHLGDPQFPDPRPWVARAHSYLRDALRDGRRAVFLLGALSASQCDDLRQAHDDPPSRSGGGTRRRDDRGGDRQRSLQPTGRGSVSAAFHGSRLCL